MLVVCIEHVLLIMRIVIELVIEDVPESVILGRAERKELKSNFKHTAKLVLEKEGIMSHRSNLAAGASGI